MNPAPLQKTIAEGAGACGLAAAMFGQRALEYDRVVAVVCGGCIDNELLADIIRNVDESNSKTEGGDRSATYLDNNDQRQRL